MCLKTLGSEEVPLGKLGWNADPTEVNGCFAINFNGARISAQIFKFKGTEDISDKTEIVNSING